MPALIFDLHIPKDEFLAWYEGSAKQVFTYARNGQSICFPANVLIPFISHHGVTGTFVIEFNADNKFKSIKRYGDS